MPSVAIIGTRGYPSYYGGFETAVRHVAPYLVDHGWDVTVYGRRGTTTDSDPGIDDRVHRVTTRGWERKSLSTLSYGFTSTLAARRARPDVALVMNVANGYWLPLLASVGIPSLVNVDGIEWDRAKWGRVAKAVFRRGAAATARHAAELVFDAHAIGERWRTDFGRDGVYIPYGGDTPAHELPIEPGLTHRGYVLIVARFVPENTVPEFFAAAATLAATTDVVLVGSSGYGGAVDDMARSLAAAHDRVTWLGHVSDDRRLHSLWQHAGVYFHGHSVGGTNPALVQAMACGAPTVARDTVYNREVLGENGVFVRPDAEAIVRSISRVLGNDAEKARLSAEGVARAKREFSWDSVNSRYDTVLRGLVRTRR